MAGETRKERPRVPPVPLHLLKTIAVRRLRAYKAIAAIVSISMAVAIAASFIVTAMTETMVWRMESRVVDGIGDAGERHPTGDTGEGGGIGEAGDVGEGGDIGEVCNICERGGTGEGGWFGEARIVGEGGDSGESGQKSGRELGAAMIRQAARAAFLPRHVVSLAAAVVALSGISCVLSVSFVGRKKSLGILKTLGGTTRDLAGLMALETAFMGAFGIPIGLCCGSVITAVYLGTQALSPWCFVVSVVFGVLSLTFGVYLPVRLVRNASCAQLLNNRPVYAFSNPSCAQCGLCGGF
jgi:hypothetical protein